MQEWIVAMLVISTLLIMRDMANTILEGKLHNTCLRMPSEGNHPQKEKVQKYAQSFQKLADIFYNMPYKTEYISQGQIRKIVSDVRTDVCDSCYQKERCWKNNELQLAGENLVRIIEEGNQENIQEIRSEWNGVCAHAANFFHAMQEEFWKEKQNLIWKNQMIENRLAMAQQMTEVAGIIHDMAENLYEISEGDIELTETLQKSLKKIRIILKNIWVMDKIEGRRQMFLTMRARSGQCVSTSEVAKILSEKCGCVMTVAKGNRHIIGNEFHTIQFIEDVAYQILYGVSKLTKEQEKISGDNYICHQEVDGRFVLCLSDGMGSGMEACQESETVVELLEQFLESGFSQETAARMINTTLLLNNQDMFSTIDACTIDLYTGICRFLKAGAAATFIKRDHWVESISSTSLAAGLAQQMDFETASRKLYHGDFLIMMTDGVLDALPDLKEEETMKEIIMDVKEQHPKEIGRGILERVLGYSDYRAKDDMTVLVAGMWRK